MKRKNIKPRYTYYPQYSEEGGWFAEKEIIFRSHGRAMVFRITSKMQYILLALVIFASIWSFYSFHIYNKSGQIVSYKDRELDATRDAYVGLIGDFMNLHKNINEMLEIADNKKSSHKKEIETYKRQASIVEDKIKQIAEEKDWVDVEHIEEKLNLNEAILQRDIATSERDELRRQISEMEDIIEELKNAEIEVFDKVAQIAGREINKIKSAFASVNKTLKKKGQYFNPLANRKNSNVGGPYIPAPNSKLKDKKIQDKMSSIFKAVDDLLHYKEVVKNVPFGKPVWSYWVTSNYGTRSDPFRKKKASHKGVDLASRTGNKIKVQANGKVTKAEYSGGYGNLVVVDHGNGFITKYAHLHKIYVKKGQKVNINDTLGEVGSTGRSTGPHLHYEVIYNGQDVDPMPFIKAKIS